MFLKAIEIRGFKSFADKIELDFKKGVTAVVGPNGSGKSNISDAIRWVLGEQSIKTLRGGKMEDVIFAGTQYRKSVGLAQVVLTLDNSDKVIPMDYNEVTIGRRLYRSGESEYYINNTKCRLKDIQEIFMDTGIGKEGYSIIGQGKIEAVLSGKSEERRGLLEEAAGIVKFKTRKEEAEKRLESTKENLVRIDDILSTYEERLEPLKIESEKAKSFVKLSEELSKREINLLVNSLENLRIKANDISAKIKNLDSEINKLNSERDKSKSNLKQYDESLYKIENLYKVHREEYYEKKSQYQSIVSDNILVNEKIHNLNNLKLQYIKDLEQLKEKINSYTFEHKKCTDEYLLLKNRLEEHNKKFSCVESNLETKQDEMIKNEEFLKKYKDEELDIVGNISDLKNLIVMIKKDIDSYDLNINQIENACESYSSSIKINANTKTSLENELLRIKVKIEKYESNIAENKLKISKTSRILSADQKLFDNLNAEINKLEANKNMLNSLEDQYEGYNKSVKNLMIHIKKGYINKENKKCIVLGEAIKVKENLEIAIEIALGSAISNIITEDEILAKDLINYLKYNKLGRATFLPLNILQYKKLSVTDSVKNTVGYIGIASELIEYDNSLTKAIEQVLGRTIIAENMNSALEISKKSNFRFKIVTLSGEVVNPGGALTGGSIYKKNFNIIGRKREIQELDSKIILMKEEINKLFLKNKENVNNIKKMDNMNMNLKDSIHFENIEITKIQGRITSIDIESKKLSKNYSISVNEINMLNGKKKEAEEEVINTQNEINSFEDKKKQLLDLQKKLEEELIIIKKEVLYLKENITSIRIEKAKLDENSINKKKEANRLNEEIISARDKCSEIENNINNFESDFFKFKNKLQSNNSVLREIEEFLSDMDVNFKETEIEKIDIEKRIKDFSDKIEEFSIIIDKKEEERHRIQLNLTRVETESDALTGRLKDEFKLDFSEVLYSKVEIYNLANYKNSIQEIKNNISKMGTVNVGAIEEYKIVKEKYNFMSNQREDLVKSKEEIINVISEMTYKMRTLFSENFERIRKNFSETFRELFKGGNADLILSGDDVLSSDIEINVEPPGKKLQNINLMSGGEKGLSAIALLFAILKMKPTPFCILDEIEAALDDANVARYADFLRKFSEKIQFIVITHRKGTMEASNILYGVTMEEKGVSKVVSVDLAFSPD